MKVKAGGTLISVVRVFCGVALGLWFYYRSSIDSLLLQYPFMYYLAYLFVFSPFVFAFSEQLLFHRRLSLSLSLLSLFFKSYLFNAILIPCSLHRTFIQVKLKRDIFYGPHFWDNSKNCTLCQK